MLKCQVENCVMCEHEDYLESLSSRACKHNQGYASSIYGGVYCVLCGLEMETIA